MKHRPEAAVAAVVFLLAFFARMHVAFFAGLEPMNTDSYDYIRMADGIIVSAPISYFPNGYPLIISLSKLLFGPQHYIAALLMLNVALSTAVVGMAYAIAAKIMHIRFALLTALTVALWPSQLNYVRQVMSEVPATFLLVSGIYAISCSSYIGKFAGGGLLFLSGFTRSTLTPAPYLLAASLFLRLRWRAALNVIGGVMALTVVTFFAYEAKVISQPSNMGVNLLIAINSRSSEGVIFSASHFSNEQRNNPLGTYVAFAKEHPREFLAQRASSLWELWGPWPSKGNPANPRSTIDRILIGARFPVFALAIAGLFIGWRNDIVTACGIPIILITLVHTAFFSTPRFSYPVEPLAILLAAFCLSVLASRKKL